MAWPTIRLTCGKGAPINVASRICRRRLMPVMREGRGRAIRSVRALEGIAISRREAIAQNWPLKAAISYARQAFRSSFMAGSGIRIAPVPEAIRM